MASRGLPVLVAIAPLAACVLVCPSAAHASDGSPFAADATMTWVDVGVGSAAQLPPDGPMAHVLYPSLGVWGRWGPLRIEIRSVLPFVIVDGIAYAIQFLSSERDPNALPLMGALNPHVTPIGPFEMISGDVWLRVLRPLPTHSVDVGLTAPVRLTEHIHDGTRVTLLYVGVGLEGAYRVVFGRAELTGFAQAGHAWTPNEESGSGNWFVGTGWISRAAFAQRWGFYGKFYYGLQRLGREYDVYAPGLPPEKSTFKEWLTVLSGEIGLSMRL